MLIVLKLLRTAPFFVFSTAFYQDITVAWEQLVHQRRIFILVDLFARENIHDHLAGLVRIVHGYMALRYQDYSR